MMDESNCTRQPIHPLEGERCATSILKRLQKMEKTPKILIVGGCGYVGQHLFKKIIDERSHCTFDDICIVDVSPCPPSIKARYEQADVTNEAQLVEIFQNFGPDLVIHLASWGMSGAPMLNPLCREINIRGAEATVSACLKVNVVNIVYTSTYNVIFGGTRIINGDETLPYFPPDGHSDYYSGSKAIAEQIMLNANGRQTANGSILKTSVIRPAAIYGENEQRHFPRIIKHIDSGIFNFRIGQALVDWVHVDNLVRNDQMLILFEYNGFVCSQTEAFVALIDKLLTVKDPAAAPAGQAYFISDGSPIDNFEFLRPLCAALGCNYPSIVLPVNLLVGLGFVLEKVYLISKAVGFPIEPFLTRAEVFKVGVSHYFSIEKATRDFGYKPLLTTQEGAERIAKYYKARMTNVNYFRFASLISYALIAFGMGVLFLSAYHPQALSKRPPMHLLDDLGLFVFRSRQGLQIVFWLAIAAHAVESCIALSVARAIGCTHTLSMWGLQTFLLGYPSLSLLFARQKFLEEKI